MVKPTAGPSASARLRERIVTAARAFALMDLTIAARLAAAAHLTLDLRSRVAADKEEQ